MKEQNKYGVKSFKFGNRNLEFFSSYGAFFLLCFIFISIFYFSIYYYFNPNIKYVFWVLSFLFCCSIVSLIFNYFMVLSRIKKDEILISFPKFIYEGEETMIDFNFIGKKKRNYVFVRFSLNNFDKMKSQDIKDIKLLYNTNNKKWGSYWGYGGYLGYNAYDFVPLDFEQISLSSNKINMFGKKRGEVVITGIRLFLFDIFGFFKIMKNIKIEPVSIMVLPKNQNKKKLDVVKIKNSISDFGHINTPNIIGVKKGRHGDSIKDTHWKIFAKKQEHWVFVREKMNLNPIIVWVDTSIDNVKEKAEQYENMLSEVCHMVNKEEINKIIISNKLYSTTECQKDIIKEIINLNYENFNSKNFNNIKDIPKNCSIVFLTINNTNENNYCDFFRDLKIKNIDVRVLKYE